ncbi:MAG: winged helix-turn-helix domain-containing protein [Candidatus Bathyarchaeota archaeon]|nr:winged helix-turn-helix domain-containing protein [Candidatus Termiticorpusculum sp.]
MGNVVMPIKNSKKKNDLTDLLTNLDTECKNCAPTSPLECIGQCHIYKLKNELRQLRHIISRPNFMKELFNTIKNKTRFHILQSTVKSKYLVNQIQQELKKTGHTHSQNTIDTEYMHPLMQVGLTNKTREEYYATNFGNRLTKLLCNFPEYCTILSAHSKCYEETLLLALTAGPKTFEDIQEIISPKSTSRILKRLRDVNLIETPKERNYIFFFKTKRDPNKETFTLTEKKVYEAISPEGISVGKLAKKTGLSIRRTYKYLHGLKGKKLVFIRKAPKMYGLTVKGEKLSFVLDELYQLVEETWSSSQHIFNADSTT